MGLLTIAIHPGYTNYTPSSQRTGGTTEHTSHTSWGVHPTDATPDAEFIPGHFRDLHFNWMHIYIYIQFIIDMCIYIYKRIYIYTYIHVYIYICIHTCVYIYAVQLNTYLVNCLKLQVLHSPVAILHGAWLASGLASEVVGSVLH